EHWMGTDAIGRDIFSRVAHGTRSSLLIGLAATGAALVAAAVIGSIAATGARLLAEIVMRVLDVVMSFPGIALAAVFVAVFGNSLPVLIFAIAFLYVPQLARVVRANVLAQFGEDYVAASQVMGASTAWILAKHVARNCIAPIMVFATVLVADAIVLEAHLLPGPDDPADHPRAEHPLRGPHRRDGEPAREGEGRRRGRREGARGAGGADPCCRWRRRARRARGDRRGDDPAPAARVPRRAAHRRAGPSRAAGDRPEDPAAARGAGPARRLPRGARPGGHPRRHLLPGAARGDHGPGRRVRLRQVRGEPGGHGAAAPHRPDQREGAAERPGPPLPRPQAGQRPA